MCRCLCYRGVGAGRYGPGVIAYWAIWDSAAGGLSRGNTGMGLVRGGRDGMPGRVHGYRARLRGVRQGVGIPVWVCISGCFSGGFGAYPGGTGRGAGRDGLGVRGEVVTASLGNTLQ